MAPRADSSPRRAIWLATAAEIENSIFTEWRLRFYGRGVAVALVIAVLFSWVRRLGHWVVEPDGKLGNIDFCWMWVSGKFAAMQHPMQIYDRMIYAAAQHFFTVLANASLCTNTSIPRPICFLPIHWD